MSDRNGRATAAPLGQRGLPAFLPLPGAAVLSGSVETEALLLAPYPRSVHALAAGRVTDVRTDATGERVEVRHPGVGRIVYFPVEAGSVEALPGDEVAAGAVLGRAATQRGVTGVAHLRLALHDPEADSTSLVDDLAGLPDPLELMGPCGQVTAADDPDDLDRAVARERPSVGGRG